MGNSVSAFLHLQFQGHQGYGKSHGCHNFSCSFQSTLRIHHVNPAHAVSFLLLNFCFQSPSTPSSQLGHLWAASLFPPLFFFFFFCGGKSKDWGDQSPCLPFSRWKTSRMSSHRLCGSGSLFVKRWGVGALGGPCKSRSARWFWAPSRL